MRRICHWKKLALVIGRSLPEQPSMWLYVTILSSRMLSRLLICQRLRCSPSTKTHSQLLDTFVPVCNIRSRHCPSSPWFDVSSQARRCLERVFRRICSLADKHHGSTLSGRCTLHIARECEY